MIRTFGIIAAILGAVSVSMGSFAAHGATKFMTNQQLVWMDKAARYNMYHALALFAVVWALSQLPAQANLLQWAGWAFIVGVILFSGSLYVMAFGSVSLGYITPLGGIAFVAGWILLAAAFWKN